MYYVVIENEIAIGPAETLETLYGKTAQKLPDDYYEVPYVVKNGELIVNPDAEEIIKNDKLKKLDAQYDADKNELTRYFVEAMLSDDTPLQTELKQELIDLDETYDEERRAILNGD